MRMFDKILASGRPGHPAGREVADNDTAFLRGSPCLPEPSGGRQTDRMIYPRGRGIVTAARQPPFPIDEPATAKVVADLDPARAAEGVDDDAPVAEKQGDGSIVRTVVRRGNIGARPILVEVAPQRPHDAAQAHFRSPSDRRLAVPSRPTTRWSWTSMPKRAAAAITRRVISMSARDGSGSPDG